MRQNQIQVDVFRLNKLLVEDLFAQDQNEIRVDDEIADVMRLAAEGSKSIEDESAKNFFRWSLKNFLTHSSLGLLESKNDAPRSFCLVREQIEHFGLVVRGDQVTRDYSRTDPPSAIAMRIVFYPNRHLFLCEHNSTLMASSKWLQHLHTMLDSSCESLQFRTRLRLEPVPQSNEVLQAFLSFEKLNRLKVKLRIPNPEISRYARKIATEMADGKIDEWLSEMQSSNGLSKVEGGLPHSVASLAQAGYKDGGVELSGIRNGQRDKVITGKTALQISLPAKVASFAGNSTDSEKQQIDMAVNQAIETVDAKYPSDDTQ